MKSFLMGTVGLFALAVASPVLAADLPVKAAPVPVAAVFDWTGFYIGINGTAILAEKRWDYLGPLVPGGYDGPHSFTGLFGGAQAGFNYQFGSWVIGADVQGDWGNARGWNDSLLFANQTNRTLIDGFGLVSGRFGYALNNALVYGKGGVGAVHEKYDVHATDTEFVIESASGTRWGPSAGVGFELAFSDHVTIAGEYSHVFLGNRDITFAPFGDVYRIHQDLDVFAVRLNYLFNGR
jgi:outer membrane immunogenic protein